METARRAGDPRLATVNQTEVLKSLRGIQQLEILAKEHQPYLDSLIKELAPGLKAWEARRTVGDKFKEAGLVQASVELSLIEEFFVMPQGARRNNPKKILEHLEKRGLNPAQLRRLPKKQQLAQIDDSLKVIVLLRYLDPSDKEILKKLSHAEKFAQNLLKANPNVETSLYRKAVWPRAVSNEEVEKAALALLSSSPAWNNSGFKVLKTATRGAWYPYSNGPTRRFAHRVLIAHTSNTAARSSEFVEFVFLTSGDKKEARFTDFWLDDQKRVLSESL